MANKKNKKSTDGSTMNGNPITTSGSAQNVPQNLQNANVPSSNQHNNNPASSNGTVTPASTATNTTTVPSGQQSNQSQNQQHHQKPTNTSSSQQTNSSKQPMKKTQQGEVEKISNSGGGSQGNQGNVGFRSSANKDQKAKEKEKEKSYQSRQGNQSNNHHHNPNHFTGGGGGGNPQNHRKKDNKNRDHSNQSHRGGAFSNNYTNHNQQSHGYSADTGKSARFPSNSSLSSSGTTPTLTVAPTPTPTSPSTTPVVQTPAKVAPAAATAVSPVITHESKTVQTDYVVVEEKEMPQVAKKDEDLCPYKNTKIKEMDTVIAFQEHDEWNKVELMCELISYLSPSDLRLLSNCIDGLTRPYVMQMKPIEKTANGVDPLGGFPPFICAPIPVLPSTFSPASSESVICNQRNMVNNLFSYQQHPPGIPPPLMPTVVFPVDEAVQHPSSSTPLNPPTSRETGSGTKSTSSTPIDISNQPDGQQQDSESGSNKGIGGSVSADLSVSKTTPELETNHNPAPNLVQSNSSSAKQTGPQIPEESEKFFSNVKDIASYLYLLISVCASTNRRSAAKLSDYASNVLIREKSQIFERIPNELDQIELLEEIGKTVVALIHHPAVTLDDKIKYIDIRDSLRTEHENLFRMYYSPEKVAERKRQAGILEGGVGELDDGEGSDDGDNEDVERRFDVNEPFYPSSGYQQPKPSSAPGTFFITRFIGRQIEKNENMFSIEIHWSDGDRTFAQRSREQIKGLQHRLLDEFGQQRSEKYTHHGMNSSFSSFDEDHKKLSTSTSTMETTFALSGDRIVPRLPREATPAQHVQYINELSDLPARMMLSRVMCEEFNGTRARTDDLLQEANELSDGLIFSRWKNPRAKCPQSFYNRDESGNINPQPYPKTIHPFLHSNIPQTQSQILLPSCSNCGGQHLMKNCEKATLLERKALAEHKMRYEAEGGPMSAAMSASTQAPGGMVPVYAQMHPQMHHPVFIDNQAMMNANHFTHHQHQQMIQSNMYLNGQYRPNGQFAESPMAMFYSPPPQVVSNCGNSSGNNSNNGNNGGGVNQNSNFS
ncbi:hypothetical protein L3Y34_015592 [Caenorhabditis briggsae]|uniref:RNA-binding protein vts1-like alpha-helical domain-containing protein n=1 Tax=Caenorhabditis briggsae TaxID=6238 RepID=A0AAE9DX46_CAEBR|nr:hypothetical protein L3Y34_015592 [Caenorhabditis briggsae]